MDYYYRVYSRRPSYTLYNTFIHKHLLNIPTSVLQQWEDLDLIWHSMRGIMDLQRLRTRGVLYIQCVYRRKHD